MTCAKNTHIIHKDDAKHAKNMLQEYAQYTRRIRTIYTKNTHNIHEEYAQYTPLTICVTYTKNMHEHSRVTYTKNMRAKLASRFY